MRFIPKAGGGFETKLKSVIDKQTIEAAKERSKTRTAMYASDYGSCLRKVWYQFFPEQYPVPDHDARTLRVFDNGNSVHERLGSYLHRESEIEFHDEIDVPRDDLEVHGRCDGRVTIDDAAMIIEFKSINKDEMYEPKHEHVGQLSWYMEMFRMLRENLRKKYGDDPDTTDLHKQGYISDVERWLLETQGEIRGEIIYESKRNNATFHFPVDYDAGRVEKVRLWFQQLKWHVDNKQRPEVRVDRTQFPCSWGRPGTVGHGKCAYYDVCWGRDDSDKKYDFGEVPPDDDQH